MKRVLSVLIMLTLISFSQNIHAQVKSNAFEQLDFANGLFERGMYEMSMGEYNKFILEFPQSEFLPEAYFGVAENYYFLKEYQKAIEAFEKYLNLFPEHKNKMDAEVRIAQCHFFLEDYDGAIARFTLLRKRPLDALLRQTVYYYSAKAYRIKQDNVSALKLLLMAQGVAEDQEIEFYTLVELGEIYLDQKEYAKAKENFQKAFDQSSGAGFKSLSLYRLAQTQFLEKDYNTSAFSFKKILEDYPGSELVPEALSNLLLSLYNMGLYEDLLQEYEIQKHFIKDNRQFLEVYLAVAAAHDKLSQHSKALEIFDFLLTSGWTNEEDKVRVYLEKAQVFMHQDDFKSAIQILDSEAMKKIQESDERIFLKAEAYFGMGEFQKAQQQYNTIVEKFPSSDYFKESVNGLAYCAQALNDYQQAVKFFRQYYGLEEDLDKKSAALYNLILLARKNKNFEPAIEYCREYRKNFQDDERAAKIYLLEGAFYSQLQRYDDAVDFYKKHLQGFQDKQIRQEALFMLGYNFQMLEKFDLAIENYLAAVELLKGNFIHTSALKNLALVHASLNQLDKTAEYYLAMIKEAAEPKLDPEVILWLSKYFIDNKEFDKALEVAQFAQEKIPEENKRDLLYFKAEALRGKSEFPAALKIYDELIDGKEEDIFTAAAFLGKGLILLEKKSFEDAREVFEKILLDYSEDHTLALRSRMELARIEKFQGNLSDASKLFMLVAILYEDEKFCPEALFEAGKIFQHLKKDQEAKKALAEIVEKYPQSDYAQKAKEILKGLQ